MIAVENDQVSVFSHELSAEAETTPTVMWKLDSAKSASRDFE